MTRSSAFVGDQRRQRLREERHAGRTHNVADEKDTHSTIRNPEEYTDTEARRDK